MDPDTENMNDYNGRQPMVNHPFDTPAYEDCRFFKKSPPNMVYLPSVELTQKMILASAQNKYGKLINDEYDILERFISTEKDGKKIKIRRKPNTAYHIA